MIRTACGDACAAALLLTLVLGVPREGVHGDGRSAHIGVHSLQRDSDPRGKGLIVRRIGRADPVQVLAVGPRKRR
jgi:hypothetical protein